MISLESVFLGLKTILYGIAFLLNQALVYLLQLDYTNADRNKIFFPTEYIIISIISTICIVFITMIYFSYKYKKNNIIETIREENI